MNISTNQNQNSPGNLKEELDDFERFALDNLVRNEWGLKVTTMNRLICKYAKSITFDLQ